MKHYPILQQVDALVQIHIQVVVCAFPRNKPFYECLHHLDEGCWVLCPHSHLKIPYTNITERFMVQKM